MIDMGVASPSAQGQAMIRTDTATIKRVGQAGFGPDRGPDDERRDGDDDDGRDEPGGHPVGHPLDGSAGTLGLGDHLHDPGQHRVATDPLGAQDQRAGLVDGAADDAVVGVLGDGHRLAGHQGLVDRGAAFLDDAVDRDLLARADAEPVTDLDLVQGHLVLGAVRR